MRHGLETFIMEHYYVLAGLKKQKCQESIDTGIMNFRKALKTVDEHLATRKFMVGEEFTFADIQIFNEGTSGDFIKMDYSEFKNFQRFREEMLKLPDLKEQFDNCNKELVGIQAALGLV